MNFLDGLLTWISQNQLLVLLIIIIVPVIAEIQVKNAYSKYSQKIITNGMTGAEVARKILEANNLGDVKVVEVKGKLTDHYNPATKTVALSEGNFSHPTIAAASIAAHEVGHALQDAQGYKMLNLRQLVFPLAQFGSRFAMFAILIGLFFNFAGWYTFGIICFVFILLFQLVTLPVEFNASSRAIKQMKELNIVTESEIPQAKSVLSAAAMTYLAAALTSLLMLLRLIAASRR